MKTSFLETVHKAFTYFMMLLVATTNIQRPIVITASVSVLSSPLFAQTSDTQLLDSLVQKYDLNNPERNHKEGGITPEMQKALDNRTSTDLTGVLSDAINNRIPSKTYDFSGYAKDIDETIGQANGMANSIGRSHGSPQEVAGNVQVEYSKKGTRKFSYDENGKLIMSATDGGGRVNGVSVGNIVSSEINNTEHNFQANTMHGDHDGILHEGAKTNVSLKSGKTGSARAYQAITNTMNRAINKRVDPDAAWLNNTRDSMDTVESNEGDFFQACSDVTTIKSQEFSSESSRTYHCQDLTKASLDYCEVERIVRAPLLAISPGMRSCGLGCFEFDLSVDTWKTSRCRTTFPPQVEADPALFEVQLNTDEFELKNVQLIGRAKDHFRISANGNSIWGSNRGKQTTIADLSGSCNAGGAGNAQGEMDVDVTSAVKAAIGDTGVQPILFRGDLKWKRSGHLDITVQIQVEDKTGRGLEDEYIQTPAGCYDALKEEEKAAKPLVGVYTPSGISGVSNGSYQTRYVCSSPVKEPLCAAGETLFGSVTNELCLTEVSPNAPYCEAGKSLEEIMINGVLVKKCVSKPNTFTAHDWSCTGGNAFMGSCNVTEENYLDENDQLILTIDADGFPIQPRDNEGELIEFKDNATCSITHDGAGEPEIPESFCVFDDYEIMEQGDGGHHPTVLERVPPFFEGDTGNKTWKVNLTGYKCNPTYSDIIGIDPDTGEEIVYTWEEVRDMENQCQVYIDNPSCKEVSRSCSEGWYEVESDRCIADTVDYECITESTLGFDMETTSNVCESAIPCAGGNCEFGENESNDRFVEAMVQASVLQGVEGDSSCEVPDDPETCHIFEGEYEYCSWDVTGLGSDCCEEPAGINIMSYVTMALATQRVNAMTGQGSFSTTVLGDVATGAWNSMSDTVVGEGLTSAWNATSSAFTSATESLFGTSAGAGVGAASTAVEAAISAVQQQLMELVYNALPEELAKMIMTTTATEAGTEYAMDGALSNIAGMVAGAYAIYTWVKLAMALLTACDDNEMDMGTKLGQRQCVKFGDSYCSQEVLGVCYQKRQDHCCYSSILARIIMEQAHPLLSKPFDQSCEGLTHEELSSLDFSQIDLSEWQALLLESGEIPTETDEQSLTGGGEMVDSQCEYTETYDPVTKTKVVEEECYATLEGGRMINAQERQTVSERTLERTGEIGGISKAAEDSAIKKVNNLNCSELPRPVVCEFGFDPREDIE